MNVHAMMVLRTIAVTPQDLSAVGIALEISRQVRPFPQITISVVVGKEQPNYRFKRIRLIQAREAVTAQSVDRITVEGPHIERNTYDADRTAEYRFVGSQRMKALLVFEYDKTDESVSAATWYCLPISTLADDENG
jgi:hypothetical protein